MIKSAHLGQLLPHDLRRTIYRLRRPTDYYEQQRRRDPTSGFPNYSKFEETGAVFIRVPKAASESICLALYGGLPTVHVRYETYRIAFPRKVFAKLRFFAFVRDPLNRARSAYEWLLEQSDDPEHASFVGRYLEPYSDFEDFVINGIRRPEIARHRLFVPQLYYVAAHGRRRPALDFIGRYEHLNEDFDKLCDFLGVARRELPHRHRSRIGATGLEISARTAGILSEIYRHDISAFGYDNPGRAGGVG